jgi:predicted metal-dependent hydrolase
LRCPAEAAHDANFRAARPFDTSRDAILERMKKRAQWICRQLQFFGGFQPRTPARRYLAGETHLYLGRRYRLKVVWAAQPEIKIKRDAIEVHTSDPHSNRVTRFQLDAWFKQRAHERFRSRLELCLARFPKPERFRPRTLIIRQLRRRWGSMTPAGRLVLNRSLLQASVHEIDYVITHELCHRAFYHHGKRFYDLLEQVMPDWEHRKAALERRLA